MITTSRVKLSHIALLAGTVLAPVASFAAGFALKEVSSSLLGSAFSSASTSSSNISSMAFNPATLGQFSGKHIYAASHMIESDGALKHVASNTQNSVYQLDQKVNNKGGDAIVPAAFYSTDLTKDIKFGVGITVPFGLTSEYRDNYAGRYHGIKSDLMTMHVNPTIAYNFNEQWTFAAGVQLIDVNAKLTNKIYNNALNKSAHAKVHGNGWGGGFSFGTLFKATPDTNIGFGFQSAIKVRVKGSTRATSDGTALGNALENNVIGSATADIVLPEKLSLGVSHDFTPDFGMSAEVQWTRWSRLRYLKFVTTVASNGNKLQSITDENWDDVFFYALGAHYNINDRLQVRLGGAFDESPVPDSTRTPRLPGNDRWWATAGVSYQVTNNITLDAGYLHVFVKDGKIALTNTGNDTNKGALNATSEAKVDVFSLGFNLDF